VNIVTNLRVLHILGIFWLAEGLLASQSGITTAAWRSVIKKENKQNINKC